MKYKIIIALLFCTQAVTAQKGSPIAIAGTQCSLVPPPNFVAATRFSGFQNDASGSYIMLTELAAPYQKMVDGFSADALQSKGMTLLSKESIDHQGSKATLLKVTQSSNGIEFIKLILLFGNNDYTVIVNGIFPETEKNIEASIKSAILTTVYNATQSSDPAAAAIFTVDVSATDFKLVKFVAGTLMYSTDGKMPTAKPTFVVGTSFAPVSGDHRQFALHRLKSLPGGESMVIKQTNDIAINGLSGFETLADDKNKDGKPVLIYQVILFDAKGVYYILLGRAQENITENLASFRKMAKTFKLK